MLSESGQKAGELRQAVTSAGGTTEAALKYLDSMNFPDIFQKALMQARDRARELPPKAGTDYGGLDDHGRLVFEPGCAGVDCLDLNQDVCGLVFTRSGRARRAQALGGTIADLPVNGVRYTIPTLYRDVDIAPWLTILLLVLMKTFIFRAMIYWGILAAVSEVAFILKLTGNAKGTVLRVKVHPGAGRTAIQGVWDRALKLSVGKPPERGAANRECLEFLAERLQVPEKIHNPVGRRNLAPEAGAGGRAGAAGS